MSKQNASRPRVAAALILCGLLLACGGGGGGDDSGGTAAPTPNTPSPSDPAANYTGRTTQATVGDANASTLADAAWFGLLLVYVLGSDVVTDPLPNGAIDETVAGSQGGTLRITGSISGGTGTLTIAYSNFSEAGATYNGRETHQILQARTSTSGSVRRTFEGLTIFTGGSTVRIIGSVTRTDSPGPVAGSSDLRWSFSGDLLFIQQGSNIQLRLAQLSLSREPREEHPEARFSELAGTARAFDSTHGYVDLAIESALRFKIDTADSAPGGSLAASGAANSKLWVTPLSREYGAIELDTAGTGKPTRSLAYRWADGFSDPAGSGDKPSATTARFLDVNDVRLGQAFTLEGRFSENAGGQFLLPSWSLLLAPPGSTAVIVDANTTRARFTPDAAGEYLFRLEVSDGTTQSSDYLHVRADQLLVQPAFPRVRVIVGPDIVVEPNTEVELDGRRTHTTNGDPLQQESWTVLNDHSGGLELQANGTQARFTTLPGQDYIARFSAMRQFSGDPARSEIRRIVSPGNVRFAPAVALGQRDTVPTNAPVTVADLDDDGLPDLLQYAAFFGNPPAEMRLIVNRGGGRFERLPEVYSGSTGDSTARVFKVVDVNGDDRVDVVTSDVAAVGILAQTSRSPLRFGAYTRLTRAADCGGFGEGISMWLIAADIDRDSDLDLVTNVPCGPDPFGRMEVYAGDSGAPTGFAPAVPLPLPGDARLEFPSGADLNDDGFVDLVGVQDTGTLSQAIAIWLGGANSTFSSASTVALVHQQIRPPLLLTDLNLDERPDIVVPTASGTFLILQRPDGSFELPSQVPVSSGLFVSGVVGVSDLDRDGRPDLLGPNSWHQQLPDGSFSTQRRYLSFVPASVVVDLNDDGRLDLINGNGPSVILQAH